jgi:putative transcriptional regulator
MTSLRGKLLIASPALLDPNFARSVVLIAEHTHEGAMGLVLNRPSDTEVAGSVDELGAVVAPGDLVYEGGPVQAAAVMVLAEFNDPRDAAAIVLGDVGFLPADGAPGLLADGLRRARVFAGHSGWGPRQLDAELEEGSWLVVPAEIDDVFAPDPDELWSEALERKGGAFARLARIPDDPSVN